MCVLGGNDEKAGFGKGMEKALELLVSRNVGCV
jgi:hypothetical protein